jgi:hypothetical protein
MKCQGKPWHRNSDIEVVSTIVAFRNAAVRSKTNLITPGKSQIDPSYVRDFSSDVFVLGE